MNNKFFAVYKSNETFVLVFDTEEERDKFVEHEEIVHDDIASADYKDVKAIVDGKTPVFSKGFGCTIINA